MALSKQSCIACAKGAQPLTAELQQTYLQELTGWEIIDNHHLSKSYAFKNYADALAWVNRLSEIAEAEDHHPDVTFGWGHARVLLWTQSIDGLHQNDFILAAKLDEAEKSQEYRNAG